MALLHIEGFEAISASTGTGSRVDAANWVNDVNYYNVGYNPANTSSPNYHPYIWGGWNAGEALSFGENGFASAYYLARHVGAQGTLITGFAFKPTVFAESETREIVSFSSVDDLENRHLGVRCFLGRHLQVVSNSNSLLLGTAYFVIHKDAWNYIEIKTTFHNSTGSYELRVNGVTVLSDTNVDTVTGTTSTTADTVILRGMDGNSTTDTSFHCLFDDWYIADTTGSAPNNNFLGPIKVETLLPTGVGDSNQFTPSAGANWQNVDEIPTDGNTSYNESSTSSHLDLFATSNLTNINGTVYGVEVDVRAGATQAQAMGCIPKVKRSTSEGTGGTFYVADDSHFQQCDHMFEQDPAAGPGVWTVTNVNAMQIGYEVA